MGGYNRSRERPARRMLYYFLYMLRAAIFCMWVGGAFWKQTRSGGVVERRFLVGGRGQGILFCFREIHKHSTGMIFYCSAVLFCFVVGPGGLNSGGIVILHAKKMSGSFFLCLF